jgi:hypothetical protein
MDEKKESGIVLLFIRAPLERDEVAAHCVLALGGSMK